MDIISRLREGNRLYLSNSDPQPRIDTAENGQKPFAIVVCCSDARVIPEKIFDTDIGDIFVIRVAGNVLDRHQLGSIEYAAAHLHCEHIIVLGHTRCGAVDAALSGVSDGFIRYITDDILEAIGNERDPYKACCLNVKHAVERLKNEFAEHPEIGRIVVDGAVYDILTGEVEWI